MDSSNNFIQNLTDYWQRLSPQQLSAVLRQMPVGTAENLYQIVQAQLDKNDGGNGGNGGNDSPSISTGPGPVESPKQSCGDCRDACSAASGDELSKLKCKLKCWFGGACTSKTLWIGLIIVAVIVVIMIAKNAMGGGDRTYTAQELVGPIV